MKHNITPGAADDCCAASVVSWRENKLLRIGMVLAAVLVLSSIFPPLFLFRETLLMYFRKIWLPIALGLVLGGMMDYYVPREMISHLLASPRKRTILYSVALGSLASSCSCGVLALSVQLYKKGASTPAVIAFLLASPWANLPLTLLLISFFGVIQALYLILAAVVIAITTGYIYQAFSSRNWVERNPNSLAYNEHYSLRAELCQRFADYRFSPAQLKKDVQGIGRGTLHLANMVVGWIVLGAGLASLAGTYIPHHIFNQYMGPTMTGMLVTLAAATVLEVCSEGTAPLAFEIYRQTQALGNSFVFLMAGVVTDYTEIGLIWQNVGWRTALWMPLITVPQVLAWGVGANMLFHP